MILEQNGKAGAFRCIRFSSGKTIQSGGHIGRWRFSGTAFDIRIELVQKAREDEEVLIVVHNRLGQGCRSRCAGGRNLCKKMKSFARRPQNGFSTLAAGLQQFLPGDLQSGLALRDEGQRVFADLRHDLLLFR